MPTIPSSDTELSSSNSTVLKRKTKNKGFFSKVRCFMKSSCHKTYIWDDSIHVRLRKEKRAHPNEVDDYVPRSQIKLVPDCRHSPKQPTIVAEEE